MGEGSLVRSRREVAARVIPFALLLHVSAQYAASARIFRRVSNLLTAEGTQYPRGVCSTDQGVEHLHCEASRLRSQFR